MKNQYKTILAVMFCAASIATVKASSGYDLLVGFTQAGGNSSGNDLIYDIGPVNPYPGATGLSNGETWNLSTYLTAQNFNLQKVQWGILGDAIASDGISTPTLWVTTEGPVPPTIPNSSTFNYMDISVNAIEQSDFGGGAPNYQSSPGQYATPTATGSVAETQNCWYQQTIQGGLSTQFVNSYANPNMTNGVSGTAILWQVPQGSSTPAKLGTFTLNTSGVLTFNIVSTATPPQPKIVNVTRLGNTSTIYFSTTNGFTYSLYFTNTLTGPLSSWPVSSTTVSGNGLTNSLSVTTTATNQFYYIGVH